MAFVSLMVERLPDASIASQRLSRGCLLHSRDGTIPGVSNADHPFGDFFPARVATAVSIGVAAPRKVEWRSPSSYHGNLCELHAWGQTWSLCG